MIPACGHDQKGIHKVAKHLLGDRRSIYLTQTGYPSELTERFSSFFINKIQNIRRDLQTDQMHGIEQHVDTSSINTSLERFTHASEDEVKILIMKSPSKSCSIDPKDCFQVVVIDSEHYKPVLLKYGVPQGLVLGQKKYTMYV